MSLLTAHRILIGTATAFFVFYGLWEFVGARSSGGQGGFVRGAMSLAAALLLLIYFRTLAGQRAARGGGREGGTR